MSRLIEGFESLSVDSHPTEEEIESISALQGVLDIIESPLFTAIVDIRDQSKKVEIIHI